MLGRLYKKLWSRIGGRKWTWIVRDTWHKLEGIWIIGLVAIGAALGDWFGIIPVLGGLGIFCVGYTFGHFFWGRSWIDGEGLMGIDTK